MLWTRYNTTLAHDTHYKCHNLTTGIEYNFRISAENLAGNIHIIYLTNHSV